MNNTATGIGMIETQVIETGAVPSPRTRLRFPPAVRPFRRNFAAPPVVPPSLIRTFVDAVVPICGCW